MNNKNLNPAHEWISPHGIRFWGGNNAKDVMVQNGADVAKKEEITVPQARPAVSGTQPA